MKLLQSVASEWAQLTESERAERFEWAAALWATCEKVKPWLELSDFERLCAARTVTLVRREQRLYRCPKCLDHLFTFTTAYDKQGNAAGEAARFCSCNAALRAEAGYWVQKLRPHHRGGKPESEHLDAYRLRLRVHLRGIELRAAVDDLLSKPVDLQETRPRD